MSDQYLLDKELIPTPLISHAEKKKFEIVPHVRSRARRIKIISELTALVVAVLWQYFTGRGAVQIARRIRVSLERLGFLWIKAGQLLSLRSDFFPMAFCVELSKLQYRAQGFPGEMSLEIVERELGVSIDELFVKFDRQPFAAASIAQVHKATMFDGTEVVVKVMRPEAEKIFTVDMKFLQFIVRWVNRLNLWRFVRWDEALWELQQIMQEEIDYRFELSNITRMRHVLEKHEIYVPKPFARYSTRRVLTMEYISGPLMAEYIELNAHNPARVNDWCVKNNTDPGLVATNLYLSFLQQLFEDNLFHGDLHPGNIILLRNSKVALIDFGTVGTAEHNLLKKYTFIIKAIANNDLQKAADLVLALVPELPPIDIDPVREDMVRALRSWQMRVFVPGMNYFEKSLTEAVTGLAKIMAMQRIMITWGFLKIDRTWATLDASMNALMPEINYLELFQRYFRERDCRQILQSLKMENWIRADMNLQDLASEYALFIDPQIRRSSRTFESSKTLVEDFITLVLQIMRIIVIAAFVLLIIGLSRYYGYKLFGLIDIATSSGLLKSFFGFLDHLGPKLQALLLIFDVYLLWKFRGFLRSYKAYYKR